MNADRVENNHTASESSIKGAFLKSSIFHAVIFIIALVGIPFAQKEPVIITPMSVELVNISELSQTNKQPPPEAKAEPIPKPKEPESPKPPKEEPEPEKTQSKPEVKEPDPIPPPKPKEPEKKPEKPKPKEKSKPKEKPKPKKEEPKQEDLFNSLLKDLTPDESKQKTPRKNQTVDPDNGQNAPIANQMSMSELDALRAQIEPCWNVPSGAKYAENLVVTLRLSMNRDMTVRNARVVNTNNDPAFRAAADSAIRAVRNPRCSPFRLPPEKYDQWKTIVINFDPGDML